MNRKSMWLLSAGLVVLSAPAFAQTTTSPDAPQPDSAPATESGNSQTGTGGDQTSGQQQAETGDIVITATRRNEALSDVPLAVSAITSETLENSGATDIRQLNQVSPSLLVSSTSSEAGAAVARIRGIGTVGDNPGLEGSVGVFIDGVYRSRTGGALTELGAIDRVEVLRGPQGTLFGRNTSAGLIHVITARPRFSPEIYGQIDVGNYDFRRFEGGITGPFSDTIAGRLDAVIVKRDGFIKNSITGDKVNDRDRWLLRGQMLFQPNDDLSFRLIADYAKRDESCCAAPYLHASDFDATLGRTVSSFKPILEARGAVIEDDTFKRKATWTEGYGYQSDVDDGGLSGELVYDLGGAELTSISAYRYNKWVRGTDADYNNLDILHRADDGGSQTRFKTFTQELRLQGDAFNNRLDWLVGGYFANEKLRVRDNLQYGSDYESFQNCLLGLNPATGLSGYVDLSSPTCFNSPKLAQDQAALAAGIAQVNAGIALVQAAIANPATPPEALPALQAQLAQLQATRASLVTKAQGLAVVNANPARPGYGSIGAALGVPGAQLNGASLDDEYNQTSTNFALFTHNIFSITDQLKLTIGARWTHEKKKLSASFSDTNDLCRAFLLSNIVGRGLPTSLAAFQRAPCFSPSVPIGFDPDDAKKTESKLSGTAVLSWKPTPELLTYASYSRGYKAGGFNLDRAGLTRQSIPGSQGPVLATATLDDLKFKPETNDAFELGAKYNGRGFDVNFAAFHQVFDNFQLNTFDGTKFIVENINSCKDDLNGADTDISPLTGACDGKLRSGVRSQGVEVELFTRPMQDLSINAGATIADVKYR